MLPLLSLHAIAAQRGDGLDPVLLAGLKRLAAERPEAAVAQSTREQEVPAAEQTADDATREEAGTPKQAT